ncbi:rhomboid-related protein 4 isoform X2 [Rhinatrema bivittatum]|uniref:rhomboid-related protein 4 isoform X2 n=1 Tax=Rhinatrema bivittatum TaxID=194408 RepID=UPI00112EB634|nr:rhomboid-related protein 4 isoform X2 [Rhinatrema bivittatum]
MQRRQRGINVGLLLLLSQIFQAGVSNIPPVTLATLAVNIFLFVNPLKSVWDVCISVQEGYQRSDWQRLLLSPFHHADDWHLYFNMISMLWKGTRLEKRLGSVLFGCIIAVFSQLIGVMYMALEMSLAEILNDPIYLKQCAVGFSGVLFALKVLINHYYPGGSSNVMGFHVPNKYACWVELIAIHVLSPGTSFVGHLAGILVGLMYTLGPLKIILNTFAGSLSFEGYSPRQTFFNNSGYARHSGDQNQPYNMPQENYYTRYTGGLNEEEQYERAVRNSLNDRDAAPSIQMSRLYIDASPTHLCLRRPQHRC